MFAFVAVRFSFPVLSQETGWAERLQNELFCAGLTQLWFQTQQLKSAFFLSLRVLYAQIAHIQ